MKKSIISSLLLLGCSLHAIESRLELRHREAAGVGYNTGYSSLDYFLMGEGESAEFLLDLRGHVFNTGRAAGNAGLGFRVPVKDDKWMIGANVFYDLRQAPEFFYNQIGAGIEWLTPYVDFRANGYIPVGTQKHSEEKDFTSFTGSTVLIRHKLQAALPCIDAEIGTPLPRPFYFAVGAYYLFKQESTKIDVGQALGVRVRADVDWGRYVTLGVVATYDHIFKTRVQGILSINIPFDKKPCKPKKKNICEREKRNLRRVAIMRNEIIPIQDKKRTNTELTDSDDDPVTFLFVSNTARLGGDGSFERPFASLKDAENASSPGDVIYVFPGDRTPRNMDEGIVLKDKQTLASSARPIVINNVEIPAQTPNIAPVLTNKHAVVTDQPIVTNPGNSRLNDFLFIPPWDYVYHSYNTDGYADARAEGFEVVNPQQAPAPAVDRVLGVNIIPDYVPASPAVAPASAPAVESMNLAGTQVNIDLDYRGGNH